MATDSAGAARRDITLIDKARTHLWKPLLHEIAAGSMDLGHHELDYLAQAHWHHFHYRIGEMIGLDRTRREVRVAPVLDENGTEVTPARASATTPWCIAVGSLTNDFGTPGVARLRHQPGDARAGGALPPPAGQCLHPRA